MQPDLFFAFNFFERDCQVSFLPAEAYFLFQLIRQEQERAEFNHLSFQAWGWRKQGGLCPCQLSRPFHSGWADRTRGQNTTHGQDPFRYNSIGSHCWAKLHGSHHLQRDWKAIESTGPKLVYLKNTDLHPQRF